ncbi:SCO family protein, partial [Myxococcota bacterium]|nr:SCO family protein [Myxococcota bacterium]
GQWVEMDVGRGEAGPEIRSARFLRWASEEEGWIESGGQRVRAERAAPIALQDTQGQPVTLDGLKGKLVLVDFIYTTCHGPCPAQTHNMRRVQRGLSDQARSRVQFLSVTIVPENDDAAALSAYATKHGVDLSDWAFLTGAEAEVEATRRGYHIGVTDDDRGGLDHSLRSYVIDDRGYLVDRYRSESFDAEQVIERLEALAQEVEGRAPQS